MTTGGSVLDSLGDRPLGKSLRAKVFPGPGGGENGGRVIAQGTPEQVAANRESLTGTYLAATLARAPAGGAAGGAAAARRA